MSCWRTRFRVSTQDIKDQSYANGTDDSATEGIDSYDTAYVISHGTFQCNSGVYTSTWAFPDTDTTATWGGCTTPSDKMKLGDHADLTQMFTAACQSVQQCVWANGGYGAIPQDAMALLAGFHGNNTDGPGIPGNVTNFVSDSRYNGVGDNWISEMNHIRLGDENDDCATVIIWAQDSASASDYFYDSGIQDEDTSFLRSSGFVFYVDGCDPDGGVPL